MGEDLLESGFGEGAGGSGGVFDIDMSKPDPGPVAPGEYEAKIARLVIRTKSEDRLDPGARPLSLWVTLNLPNEALAEDVSQFLCHMKKSASGAFVPTVKLEQDDAPGQALERVEAKIRKFMRAFGISKEEMRFVDVDGQAQVPAAVGKRALVTLGTETYEGETRNRVITYKAIGSAAAPF